MVPRGGRQASTYSPQATVGPGRPPCANCGAAWRLHLPARGLTPPADAASRIHTAAQWLCPTAYRPATLEVAQRELEQAEASGDANRIFVARGEVQRLRGRP